MKLVNHSLKESSPFMSRLKLFFFFFHISICICILNIYNTYLPLGHYSVLHLHRRSFICDFTCILSYYTMLSCNTGVTHSDVDSRHRFPRRGGRANSTRLCIQMSFTFTSLFNIIPHCLMFVVAHIKWHMGMLKSKCDSLSERDFNVTFI